ncbi:MAG: hypothetical protein A2Y77_12780 [Planctomycetes bacterium RBG_13_62_9]|nr:MAG: hypothetical protein A2Y77_12780 [Planctomycetes bacterium RBG_13_62_9]
MQLIVVRAARGSGADVGGGLLRYALSVAPLNGVVLDGLRRLWCCPESDERTGRAGWTRLDDSLWVLPRDWQTDLAAAPGHAVYCDSSLRIDGPGLDDRSAHPWVVVTNGRFAARTNRQLLGRLLETTDADAIAVTAASDLLAYQERVRLTRDGKLVGYRRQYGDSMSPIPLPGDWPHHLLVRRRAFGALARRGLPASFETLVDRCRAEGLRLQSVAVAGSAFDLESEEGLLGLCRLTLSDGPDAGRTRALTEERRESTQVPDEISPGARLVGPVQVGRRVTIEAGAVIVGPAVLCDHSTVGRDAIVDSSIVGAKVSVEPNQVLGDRVVTASEGRHRTDGVTTARTGRLRPEHVYPRQNSIFRRWPKFSYARCLKRIADVIATIFVLILFAPIIPIIALAVKISSPGPVFFRDRRQGLHGKFFNCIKFRTMRRGADKMLDKLRYASEVDGPQFKMTDDPRITAVGRFLRETYLDEIPQFFNVLRGQMSVVGPRPSPESENTLCPSWRDARLSVRPGVTGLWQVCRTRQSQMDFQEWILYDTQYVRDFSFGLDLWICWRTFRRMVENFINQF